MAMVDGRVKGYRQPLDILHLTEGHPILYWFPPLMVMVSSSLALAYVGSNRRTVFLSYRGHFPLGPYVERLGEGVPNLAWNLYYQASATEGDPRREN